MNTEDIINAIIIPLGAAALNNHGHPADAEAVINKTVIELNRLNEYDSALNWSLSELRTLFVEYGPPACDRGAVRPAPFAAWVVGLVESLRGQLEDEQEENRRLRAKLDEQKPADTPAKAVLWNRPEQFGLPPGYTINNPDNLSPDQIGEGYRIATTADDTNLPHELFKGNKLWGSASCLRGTFAEYPHYTYRVPADRPLPPLENAMTPDATTAFEPLLLWLAVGAVALLGFWLVVDCFKDG